MSKKVQLLFCYGDSAVGTFREIDMKTGISISYGIPVNKREGILECVDFFFKVRSFIFIQFQSSGIIENSDHRKRVRPWEGLVVNTLESCDIMTS